MGQTTSAGELRIGNLAIGNLVEKRNGEGLNRIDWMDLKMVRETPDLFHQLYRRIVLDEEWLKRLGFQNAPETGEWSIANEQSTIILVYTNFIGLWILRLWILGPGTVDFPVSDERLVYLDQLQNYWYFLTGESLTLSGGISSK